jgi:hypothetical protein
MKALAVLLLMTTTLIAEDRIDFNPYENDSRTIEYDMSSGLPVVVSDVTIPEGVGFVWIFNPRTQRAVVEYSRQPYYQRVRVLQSIPMPFPFFPYDSYDQTQSGDR